MASKLPGTWPKYITMKTTISAEQDMGKCVYMVRADDWVNSKRLVSMVYKAQIKIAYK